MVDQTEYQMGVMNMAAEAALSRMDFLSRPSVMLGVKLSIDGNQWCALYGQNLQEGVCGFGDTPDEACKAFDKEWYDGKVA